MKPIDNILNRLDKVKSRGKDQWTALCPAHDDRSPSLSISETADHTVLLKCWAGCSADAIVHALDMELRDLFPGKHSTRASPSQAAIEHERAICLIGQASLERGEALAPDDLARFTLAKQRLGAL